MYMRLIRIRGIRTKRGKEGSGRKLPTVLRSSSVTWKGRKPYKSDTQSVGGWSQGVTPTSLYIYRSRLI